MTAGISRRFHRIVLPLTGDSPVSPTGVGPWTMALITLPRSDPLYARAHRIVSTRQDAVSTERTANVDHAPKTSTAQSVPTRNAFRYHNQANLDKANLTRNLPARPASGS